MTQPTIKLLLLAAIAVIGWYSLRGGKRVLHRVVWRAFVVPILCAGVLSILFPGGLIWVAHRVGVGRGADLLLYVLTVRSGCCDPVSSAGRPGAEVRISGPRFRLPGNLAR
jgi:small membrane protein